MKIKKLILTLSLLGIAALAPSAYAYILKYKTITHRLTENRGSGIYAIDQVVTLYGPMGEPLVVNESWLVDAGSRMRMRAKMRADSMIAFDTTNIYDNAKKTFVTGDGRRMQASLPEGLAFEPLLYIRNSAAFNVALQRLRILTSRDLIEDKTFSKKPTAQPNAESFVRLARVGGSVSYAIGPAPTTDTELPGVWIEQDTFVVRKVRLPSGAILNAKKYSRYDGGLWLPQEREIVWGENRALIELVSAKQVSNSSNINQRFSVNSLNTKDEPHLASKIPEVAIIKNFIRYLDEFSLFSNCG